MYIPCLHYVGGLLSPKYVSVKSPCDRHIDHTPKPGVCTTVGTAAPTVGGGWSPLFQDHANDCRMLTVFGTTERGYIALHNAIPHHVLEHLIFIMQWNEVRSTYGACTVYE